MKYIIAALVLFLVALPASADPPRTFSYQGVLTDNAGTPVADGNYSLGFRLYTVAAGGSPIWLEFQNLPVTNGRFEAILGSNIPLTAVNFDEPYWLGITVNADPEMTPRTELSATPYAINALSVEDGTVTTNKLANNAVISTKMANGTAIRSLNGLTDNVNLLAGTGMTVVPSGSNITISATGGGGSGNDPGVASQKGVTSGGLTGPGTINNLVTLNINCPGDGYVLAIATCHIFLNHSNGLPTYAWIGTSTSPSTLPTNQTMIVQVPDNAGSGTYTFPATAQAIYPVTAGSNTFYMNGERGSNGGSASVGDRTLNLIYFENAYGIVTPQLTTDGPDADAASLGKPGPTIASSQPINRGGDVRSELAELRARLAELEAKLNLVD